MNNITIEEQIRAVKRELSLRMAVYPRRVLMKKMTEEQSSREIAAMQGVLNTLEGIAERHRKQPALL